MADKDTDEEGGEAGLLDEWAAAAAAAAVEDSEPGSGSGTEKEDSLAGFIVEDGEEEEGGQEGPAVAGRGGREAARDADAMAEL